MWCVTCCSHEGGSCRLPTGHKNVWVSMPPIEQQSESVQEGSD